MDNKVLSIVYTIFLGLILALFIGLAVSTFYPSPKAPEYPTESHPYTGKEITAEQIKAQKTYDTQFKQWDIDNKLYSRNVSVIALASAIGLLVIGFAFERRNQVIANGLLLGGVFTILYSITRGFVSEDTKYTFIAVSVGLIVALYLGYRRFSQETGKKSKKRR